MKWTLNKQLLLPLVAIFVVLTVVGTIVGMNMSRDNARNLVDEQLRSTSGAVGLLVAEQERELRELAASAVNVVDAEPTVA